MPGDLVTDLQRAGVIEDPLFGANFKNASVWNGPQWNYTTTFHRPRLRGAGTPSEGSSKGTSGKGTASAVDHTVDALHHAVDHLLVFDGVKMGAKIYLNGE